MICANPMAEPGTEYVIHTQEPRFIAQYTPDGPISDFGIVQEIDSIAAFYQGRPERMAGLMRRLGDWWQAYSKWEEDNG